jgi:hypothetical protein
MRDNNIMAIKRQPDFFGGKGGSLILADSFSTWQISILLIAFIYAKTVKQMQEAGY